MQVLSGEPHLDDGGLVFVLADGEDGVGKAHHGDGEEGEGPGHEDDDDVGEGVDEGRAPDEADQAVGATHGAQLGVA